MPRFRYTKGSIVILRCGRQLYVLDCFNRLLSVPRHQLRNYLRCEYQITRQQAEAMIDAAKEFIPGEYPIRRSTDGIPEEQFQMMMMEKQKAENDNGPALLGPVR